MIYLTQWLCPLRHCSVALAWDSSNTTFAQVLEQGEEIYRTGQVNRWCGICGSRAIIPEHGITRFKSMEQALPELRRLEREQVVASSILKYL